MHSLYRESTVIGSDPTQTRGQQRRYSTLNRQEEAILDVWRRSNDRVIVSIRRGRPIRWDTNVNNNTVEAKLKS